MPTEDQAEVSSVYPDIGEESEDDSGESESGKSDENAELQIVRKEKRGLIEDKIQETVKSFYSRPVVEFFENLQEPLGDLESSEMENEVLEQQIRMLLLEKSIEVCNFNFVNNRNFKFVHLFLLDPNNPKPN